VKICPTNVGRVKTRVSITMFLAAHCDPLLIRKANLVTVRLIDSTKTGSKRIKGVGFL